MTELVTTLNKIETRRHCRDGWEKLLVGLGKTEPDDDPLPLMKILELNGIEDAVWALQCFKYREYCLFLADVAESVLHIYESKYNSKAPRQAIQAIRDWHAGEIDDKALADAADSAYAAAHAAAYATHADAYAAADAAANAADAYAYAAADAAAYAAADDAADAAWEKKWRDVEALFVKHFGG